MPFANPTSAEIRDLLAATRSIAVVGLSPKPERDSYRVSRYMQMQGYRIIPVNPGHARILDEPSFPRLAAIPTPQPIDMVNLFRRSELVGPHVDEAIERGGVRSIWMQMGIRDEAAARRAEAAGIVVVMDRCLMVDHGALLGRR
jgi:predicted CoA-binding protein